MKSGPRQSLPPEECAFLRALIDADVRARARALHDVGWSLAAIAAAFDPPRQRSTVRAWVLSKQSAPPLTQPPLPLPPSSSSSFSSESFIAAAEKLNSSTSYSSPAAAPTLRAHGRRRVFDPERPVLTAAEKREISRLAPLARRYRARTPAEGTYARANRDLTRRCRDLYLRGASVRELSLAAGVTYRAMARRLGR